MTVLGLFKSASGHGPFKCFMVLVLSCVLITNTNSNNFQAIMEMRSPQNVKEAQRLASRIASLSRFLPRIAERARLIMNLLKKTNDFV